MFVTFQKWIQNEVSQKFPNAECGIADQNVENIAWLKLNTKGTISGIKIWDTGDYYCEILTLDKEEPDMAVFKKMGSDLNFSDEFSIFLERILAIDAQAL